MKLFFKYFILLFVSLALVSCVSRKPEKPVILTETKTIKETIRDTIFKVEADSSFYYAFVECRDGKPFINEGPYSAWEKNEKASPAIPVSKSGKYLEKPKVSLADGLLQVGCEARAQELFAKWKETFISEQKPVPVPVPVIQYVDKPPSFFQRVLTYGGWAFYGIIALALIGYFFKRK
ncbi:hypothetical protein CMU30_02280 [Elizabethkingia anophelis]|nr:hypothetical protein [Elizabethkingia anophelis]MDV3682204.1 hypothetical protein [Elizabethkingia anophelis]MDV3701860.1 hypothetical protein [Elizabethkingia anophelis]MDV3761166.1 hypothetical protein [Elizabethkingia anophelis]MDV3800362.1 hypothetical protein [Elizabethkingia anophelis]